MTTASKPPPALVVDAQRHTISTTWSELWQHRELLYFLTWREVKVRYKQTVLGASWAILQPLIAMMIFSLLFGRLGGLSRTTGEIPYSLHVFAGLVLWLHFANAVTHGSGSLLSSVNLVTKVYFPRIAIPIAVVAAGLIDLAMAMVVLVGMIVYFDVGVGWELALAPMFALGATMTSIGVVVLISALSVAYRDFKHIVPFLVQIWLFVTPVIYPITFVPPGWRIVIDLNPLAGFVEGFRASVLQQPLPWGHIGLSALSALAFFIAGIAYFRRVERTFADII